MPIRSKQIIFMLTIAFSSAWAQPTSPKAQVIRAVISLQEDGNPMTVCPNRGIAYTIRHRRIGQP